MASKKKKPEEGASDFDLGLGGVDLGVDLGMEDEDLDLDLGDEEEEEDVPSPLDDIVQYTGDLERDLRVELEEGAKYANAEVPGEIADTVVLVFESTPQKRAALDALGIRPQFTDPDRMWLDGAVVASALGLKGTYSGETLTAYLTRQKGDEIDLNLNLDMSGADFGLDLDFDLGLAAQVESAVGGEKVESAAMQAMLNQFAANHWADYYDGSFYALVYFDAGADEKQAFLAELQAVEDEFGCVNAYEVWKRHGWAIEESTYRDKPVKVSEEVRLMSYVKEAEVAPSFADFKKKLRKDLT